MANSKTNKITILSIIIVIVITIAISISSYLHIKHIDINPSLSLLNLSKKESVLYPIEVNGKYGFINKSGKEIIPPKFDEAQEFSEGLAAIREKNKVGFINENGQIVIKPKYNAVSDFSEGLAAIFNGKKWGFIDKSGLVTIMPQFYDAYDFSEGLAAVTIKNKKGIILWGYINKSGKFIISPRFVQGDSFREGLAHIQTDSSDPKSLPPDDKFIDKTGKVVINLTKQYLTNSNVQGTYNTGYSPDNYAFHEGLVKVYDTHFLLGAGYENEYNYGYVDKQGKLVIKTRFDTAGDFAEDLATASVGAGINKIGYIDKSGKFVIQPQFDEANDFSEGLASVLIGDKYGYIDKTGKFKINPKLDCAGKFRNGLATACYDNKSGYIDKTGKFVWYHIDKPAPEQIQDNSQEPSNISKNIAVDFTPYMQNLQKRIKSNWNSPKGKESKNVVLFFKINKDGSINNLKVQKSSGNQEVDNAALEAVNTSTPLDPLPEAYKGSSVPIEFKFDYNVFDKNGKKQK